MRQHYPGRRTLLSLLAFSSLIPAFAGNIPQYIMTKGGPEYKGFSDGNKIAFTWPEGRYGLFPDGKHSYNPRTAPGFPIGFEFILGGVVFDQFIPDNNGRIYLGKGEVAYGQGAFNVGMSPIAHGIQRCDLQYKTTGEEGNRVLTMQFKNATLATTAIPKGEFNLQIRLYESDGRVEYAFEECETTNSSAGGFDTGIRGWDSSDVILLTAKGLDSPVSVSPKLKADMLDPESFIKWDSKDIENYYMPVFTLTPVSDKTAPASAPENLQMTQNGNVINITCDRAPGADATVLLYSTSPFTDADMPEDGETFRAAYMDSRGRQIFPMRLGEAYPLYYGNAEKINAEIQNVEEGATYYVRAISANGYPAYNRTLMADKVFTTSQAAPSSLTASAAGEKNIMIKCVADNPVIIAATTEREPGYNKGYNGLFGIPSSNAKVGDEIEGGGHIVYVGDAGEFSAQTEANAMTYFRAWTVKDGILSATSADCACAPAVSLPFIPAIEEYPQGESIKGWSTQPLTGDNVYIPMPRNNGTDNAVKALSINGQRLSLFTPPIPLNRPVKVSFEWAMETVRPAEASDDSGDILLPKGNKPGEFGSGSLDLSINGTIYRSVNKYDGTMTVYSGDEYLEGSSTFVPFEAEIPQSEGSGNLEISFAGDAENTSMLYLRSFRVEAIGEVPVAPSEAPTALAVDEDRDGFLHVSCEKGSDAAYTLVLISEKPITASDIPVDGTTAAVGSKSGNASVLYWGTDEKIVCSTTADILISDYDKTYYVVAVSASKAPLYNREKMTRMEYRTLPDFGAPVNLAATFDTENNIINITAKRHENAASTLILVSDAAFDGTPEDGQEYAVGDALGNAKVAYNGEDAEISAKHVLTVVPDNVTVTAYSRNPKGWYSNLNSSVSLSTINVGVESVVIDNDLREAEIYNVAGVRLHVNKITELPAGIYIVNGNKVILK